MNIRANAGDSQPSDPEEGVAPRRVGAGPDRRDGHEDAHRFAVAARGRRGRPGIGAARERVLEARPLPGGARVDGGCRLHERDLRGADELRERRLVARELVRRRAAPRSPTGPGARGRGARARGPPGRAPARARANRWSRPRRRGRAPRTIATVVMRCLASQRPAFRSDALGEHADGLAVQETPHVVGQRPHRRVALVALDLRRLDRRWPRSRAASAGAPGRPAAGRACRASPSRAPPSAPRRSSARRERHALLEDEPERVLVAPAVELGVPPRRLLGRHVRRRADGRADDACARGPARAPPSRPRRRCLPRTPDRRSR